MADEPAPEAADEAAAAAPEPELLHGVPVTRPRGQVVLHPSADELPGLLRRLRDDHGFLHFIDLTGVDYLTHPGRTDLPPGVEPERFEVVVNLLAHATRERVRLRVQVPAEHPVVRSSFEVYPGAEAFEREVYDMFGIAFEGHPDLTRILMPDDWDGHPLRKDHGVGRIPVQFKGAPSAR